MKKGLVLEGGGMRGVFTCGVLDYLLEKNIKFEYVIGVSAGALNATRFLSNQPKKGLEVSLKYLNNKDYCSIYSLIKTGNIFGHSMLFDKIPFQLDPLDNDYFKKSKVEFNCVATNCLTGKPTYFKITDFKKDMHYLKASSSLPLLSTMINIDNNYYLDGGLSDSIPVKEAINSGCNKVVVIMTQPKDYRKKQNNLYKPMKYKYKDYPGIVNAARIRHKVYNETLDYLYEEEKKGNIFIIQPDTSLGIKRTDKNKERLTSGYNAGYNKAKEIYEDLIKYLK